jgi:hypothetical protein
MQVTFDKVPKLEGFDFKSTIPLAKDRDTIGYMGQAAVALVLDQAEASPYFNPDLKGDEFDFKLDGERIDVKSSTLGNAPPYCPKCRLLVRDGTKETDRYVFCKVDSKSRKVYIVGTITYNRFQEISKPFKAKYPCRYVLRKDLEPFEVYAEKVKKKKIDS